MVATTAPTANPFCDASCQVSYPEIKLTIEVQMQSLDNTRAACKYTAMRADCDQNYAPELTFIKSKILRLTIVNLLNVASISRKKYVSLYHFNCNLQE